MRPTRRDFLRASALVSCGPTVPLFLARSAAAVGKPARDNVLVVVELTGGNDGLNTVVPFQDDAYRKHRPRLHIAAGNVLKIDDRLGFHPALADFDRLLQDRRLAIVQSVGYPNPNRSHFTSMAIWQSARLRPTDDTPGWLARLLDTSPPRGDAPALHVSDALLPQALAGGRRHVPSLVSLEQFRRRLNIPEAAGAAGQREAIDQLMAERRGGPGSLLEFVEQNTTLTYASSARLEGVLKGGRGAAGYPEVYGLARRLRLIARLIHAGLTSSIYYTSVAGFDTHAGQAGQHDGLLREVGSSLEAFVNDLKKGGHDRRVLVLVFSEFGRRLGENASGGTDHGTAAPVFLLGGAVKAGVHGPYPDLNDLADGDPKHAIDFRRVYATVLERWLGCKGDRVLGEKFEHVGVLS